MKFVLFEDTLFNDFYPLSSTRPVWELLCGCMTIRERWEVFLMNRFRCDSTDIICYTRPFLVPMWREVYTDLKINEHIPDDEEVLFINCRLMPFPDILNIEKNVLHIYESKPLLAWCDSIDFDFSEADIQEVLINNIGRASRSENSMQLFKHLWDIVDINNSLIEEDIKYLEAGKFQNADEKTVTIIGRPDQFNIEEDVTLEPFVCVDVTGGPVMIGSGSRVNAFSRIEGPCFIGGNCVIQGAKIRSGCSIGDCCRVGGEVEQSIFQGNSNKYHDGFIGHAFIGEWVNLGAMTANSDLKNNYTEVKVRQPGGLEETGLIKVGCFLGDFTKTSIGTLINTGSSIGTGCMLVHSGEMAPRYMPPFTRFSGNCLIEEKDLSSFYSTCSVMMQRRNRKFTDNHMALLEHLHSMTAEERNAEVNSWKERQN